MKIECSKCEEMIETTAKSVVSPYVCDDCRTAAIFQDMIAPASKMLAPEIDPPDSTEATTEIIVDLEEQIAQGSELIADMKSQLDEKDADIDFLVASNLKLFTAFWQLRNSRDRLAKEIVNLRDDLARTERMNQKNLFYRNRYFEQTQELLGRGFWARVFNSQ